ncbi:hypothetical protein LY76DRAFT_593213 [Colletotrichum caudatum]|nr:hypothetical protein LY76DRAFT_593213 [Colletotrichum caudatum]
MLTTLFGRRGFPDARLQGSFPMSHLPTPSAAIHIHIQPPTIHSPNKHTHSQHSDRYQHSTSLHRARLPGLHHPTQLVLLSYPILSVPASQPPLCVFPHR